VNTAGAPLPGPAFGMVAGEASGDLLGGLLLAGLRQRWPQSSAFGIGGPRLAAEGFDAWWPHEKLAVRGYVEVLRHYREIKAIRDALGARLVANPPDLFIGVDAPDFNLGLEARLRSAGIPAVHFVCPSIWAWRPGRVQSIARSTDHVLCLFPFEPPLLTRHGIDATYVGDLMAAAGVSYTVGREPESQYGETIAGVRRGDTNPRVHYTQKDKDHFTKDVDPYVKPGDPSSGLLPYIVKIDGLTNGQGDKKIQAYNYRVCLTTDPALRIPIEKPEGYKEIDHELLLRNFEAGDMRMPALIEPLEGPGSKVDWNNMHAVGSDHPGANYAYPEASYERRLEIEKQHKTYILGFLWTMANSPRVPEEIRKKSAAYGLPKDEFTDNGNWPWMIYIREARRMVGDYVMTQHDCEGKKSAPDPVALGSFGMDSHCVQHIVTDKGTVQNEGVIWRVPPKPYGISYRSVIPKVGECENLFSPICLSTSHVAHGSIRMEPVFMALSQSCAIAASLAIEKNVAVQKVDYKELKVRLLDAKQVVEFQPASRAKP